MKSDPFRERSHERGSVSRTAPTLLLVVTTIAIWGCGDSPSTSAAPEDQLLFTDETEASGLDFLHENGATGRYYFPEIGGGPGGALVDVDGDGDLDLYAVQGTMLDGRRPTAAMIPPAGGFHDRLYLSEANPSAGSKGSAGSTGSPVIWRDVTAASGLESNGYGMGVAVGDIDNDGWPDLYVTNFGSNQLWRNRGDGTFEDRTLAAGVDDPRWSTSAIFLDFDRDGWLDLFVTTYVDYRIGSHRPCRGPTGRPEYCGPQAYAGEHDRLFRNLGDGTFANVTARMGLLATDGGSGLGVVAADFDADGWIDLYVANDLMPNQLWHNRGLGPDQHLGFEDWGLLTGSALDFEGKAQASMGVDVGDLDNDGDEDLFMTHLVGDTNTVYLNDGGGMFSDRSRAAGMRQSTPYTGFGTVILDVDNDGWLDLAAVHGAVSAVPELESVGDSFPYDQPNQLFLNRGGGRDGSPAFEDVTSRAGDAFTRAETSRGLAVGDVDNDGDPDLVVFNTGGPARLLINRVGQDRAWVGLRLVGMSGLRDMLGTRVELLLDGAPPRVRRVRTGASFLSAGDSRVLFGLGDREEVPAAVRVRVEWPDGATEHFANLAVGRYHSLVKGSGRSQERP